MTIIGTRNSYSVYIYARKFEELKDSLRDETEVKVPLKYTIADGLLIQPWEGISNMPRNQLVQQLQFNKSSLNDALSLETRDVRTTNWVIAQNEYQDVFEQLVGRHPFDRIEQRTVVVRGDGIDIEDFSSLISRALSMAESLDTITVAHWKKHAESHNWDLRSKNRGGHPSLKGVTNELNVKVVVQDNYNPFIEMHFELPMRFPKDFQLAGKDVVFPAEHLREGFEGVALFQTGKYSVFRGIQNDKVVSAALIPIFENLPKSYLKDRNLVLMCPGKCNDMLDKWLDKGLALAEVLLAVCPPKVS